jgi:hypothetical protein
MRYGHASAETRGLKPLALCDDVKDLVTLRKRGRPRCL